LADANLQAKAKALRAKHDARKASVRKRDPAALRDALPNLWATLNARIDIDLPRLDDPLMAALPFGLLGFLFWVLLAQITWHANFLPSPFLRPMAGCCVSSILTRSIMSRLLSLLVLSAAVSGCTSNEPVSSGTSSAPPGTGGESNVSDDGSGFVKYEHEQGLFATECPANWNPQHTKQPFLGDVVHATSPDKRFRLQIITTDANPFGAQTQIEPGDALKPLPTDTPEEAELKKKMKEQLEREKAQLEELFADNPLPNNDAALPDMSALLTPELIKSMLDEMSQPIFAGWEESHKDRMLVRPGRATAGQLSGYSANVKEFESEYLDTKEPGKSWAAVCLTDDIRLFAVMISGPAEQWDIAERVTKSFVILNKPADATQQ
jgi:hypothetical protein